MTGGATGSDREGDRSRPGRTEWAVGGGQWGESMEQRAESRELLTPDTWHLTPDMGGGISLRTAHRKLKISKSLTPYPSSASDPIRADSATFFAEIEALKRIYICTHSVKPGARSKGRGRGEASTQRRAGSIEQGARRTEYEVPSTQYGLQGNGEHGAGSVGGEQWAVGSARRSAVIGQRSEVNRQHMQDLGFEA